MAWAWAWAAWAAAAAWEAAAWAAWAAAAVVWGAVGLLFNRPAERATTKTAARGLVVMGVALLLSFSPSCFLLV